MRQIIIALFFAFISNIALSQTYTLNSNLGTQTGCTGTFYDGGGSGGNYANSSNYTVTFCSGSTSVVKILFSAIDINNNDHLYVYDGTGTGETLLYDITNYTSTNVYIQGTSPCITILFTSNNSGVAAGWTGTISCVAVPANDACANAISVTPGATCSTSSGTIANATQSLAGCVGTAEDDVWYKFVAGSTSQQINVTPGSGFDPVVQVFSGTCAALTSLDCEDAGFPTGSAGSVTLTGLTAGTTYYYRIYDYYNTVPTNTTFTTCVVNPPAGPANDNPCSATALPVGATCSYSNYTTVGATPTSGVPAPGCAGSTFNDVWFSVVVPANGNLILDAQTGVVTDGGMALYSGACGSLTLIECDDDDSPNGMMPYINKTGLTPGSTVFVRFWEYGGDNNGTFGICAQQYNPPPPTNQDCSNAIPICQSSYSTTTSYTGTGNIANEINTTNSCLTSGEKNDVWYTFTVQQSGNLNFLITPVDMTNDYDWAVYNLSSSNCADIYSNAALEVSCNFSATDGTTGPNGGSTSNSQTSSGTPYNKVINVTAGQTYVINVSNFSSSQDGYTINFAASTATIFDNIKPVFQSVVTPVACGSNQLTFNFSENVMCNTVSNNDFTLTGPGGPYTISNWSSAGCAAGAPYDNTYTITVNPPITTSGSFTLSLVNTAGSVADACGNVALPASFNFTINNMALTTTPTNVLCAGANTGSATVSISSGGTFPFTYLWSPTGQTTATASNLTGSIAGTAYTVTVTDALGCRAVSTVTITEPAGMNITNTIANASCGLNNGSVDITVTGATSPYSYSWTGPSGYTATSQDISGRPAGTYYVTVTSNGGCTASASYVISSTALPSSAISYTGNKCVGQAFSFSNAGTSGGTHYWAFPSGTPATTTTGSDGPISVTWNAAGSYTVSQMTSVSGCSSTTFQNITVFANPTPTVSAVNPTCYGVCNGSATASGGTSYLWSNPTSTAAATASGLCSGTYYVTVTNANGCSTTTSVTLTAPAELTANITVHTDVTCPNGNNGTATVDISGGTPGYTYAWSNGSTTAATTSTTNTVTGLTGTAAGTPYTVTVTDSRGCVANTGIPSSCFEITSILVDACIASAQEGQQEMVFFQVGPNSLNSSSLSVTWPSNSWLNVCTNPTFVANVNATITNGGMLIEPPGGIIPAGAQVVLITSATPTDSYNSFANLSYPLYVIFQCGSTTGGHFGNSTTTGTKTLTMSFGAGCNDAVSYVADNLININGTTGGTATVNNGASVVYNDAGTPTYTNNGCVAPFIQSVVTIYGPPAFNVTTSYTDVSCFGAATGSASIVVTGGTPGYTYNWSGGAGTASSATGLVAGTYFVTATDTKGCTTSASILISQPTIITTSILGTNINCNGGTTGAADLTVSGGTPPYTYSWTGPSGYTANTEDLTGRPAGTYNVTVTDSKGCTKTANITLTEPPVLTATMGLPTMVSCNGGNNGSVTVTAGGGTPAYNYAWSAGGSTTATASNLTAGNYYVTVSDSKGCTKSAFIEITGPPLLTATMGVPTMVSCNGGNNGSVTVTAGGGTPGYNYSWSGGAGTAATASNLTAGNYYVTVTDSKGCTKSAFIAITAPTVLTATMGAPTMVNCNGGNNGSVTVTAGGGTPGYNYAWSAGGSTTATASNLTAGNYYVTVTDSKGCTKSAFVAITEPILLTATMGVPTMVNCNGGNNGSVTVTAGGGTPGYNYAWSAGGSTTATASNLTAGNYYVTVSDSKGCTKSAFIAITEPTLLTATMGAPTMVNCNGGNNGSVTVTAGGGTPGYNYAWSAGGSTTATASNLTAGNYYVTVTDSKGCTKSAFIAITEPTLLTAIMGAPTMVSCNGGNNGSVTVTAGGGTPGYNYSWSGGAGTAATASNLTAGNYYVTVTDSKGCTKSAFIAITAPSILTAVISASTNATCGASNGSATVTAGGGTPGYNYSWSGGAGATATASNLSAITYYVTVTDSKSCTATASVSISNSGGPTASMGVPTNVSCSGGSDGSVTVTITASTPNYTYTWSNGSVTNNSALLSNTVTGLSAGPISVNITDGNGCTATANSSITEPNLLTATMGAPTMVSCNGGNNGSVTVTAGGGTPGYNYAWSAGGSTTATASNLTAGNYYVTVTDSKGCTKSAFIAITEPLVLGGLTSGINVTCFGGNDGEATVTPSGGTAPYSYFWQNLQTTQTITGLTAGNYSVTITDNSSCTFVTSFNVSEPVAMNLNTSFNDATCGAPNGDATVTVTGGTANYNYSWSNGSSTNNTASLTNTISGLIAGPYSVTVTDGNNCSVNTTISVNNTGAPTATIGVPVDVSCNGGNDGSISVTITGGTPNYTYTWSNGSVTNNTALLTNSVSNLTAGPITVIITDASGCTASASAIIGEPTGLIIAFSSQTNVSCNGGSDGAATINALGGTPGYTYTWTGGVSTTTTASGLSANTYFVTVTDTESCTATASVVITEPSLLTLGAVASNVSCNGGSNGSITATANNGTPGYTYLWSNGATGATASGLIAGNYTVTASDSYGCTATASATVSEPVVLALNGTSVNSSCGQSDGSATVTVSGGTSDYDYSWSNSSSTNNSALLSNTINLVSAGSYGVTVTDNNGCTANISISVSDNLAPTATISNSSNVSCNGGNDGSVTVSVAGGTPDYDYVWSNGSTTNNSVLTTNTISALPANNYSVTVTDANGCISTATQAVMEPSLLQVVFTSQTNVSCNGGSDGAATINASGGTPGYTYTWTGGVSTATTASGLSANTYFVTVTDTESCTATASVIITEPSLLTLGAVASNVSCNGGSNGSITATANNGTPGYTYLWSNGATGATASGLIAGNYTVTASDSYGCTATSSATVSEPVVLALNGTSVNSSCGQSDGSATVTVSGGTSDYDYFWSNSSTTNNSALLSNTISLVAAGSYGVTVTDNNGCTANISISVSDNLAPTATISNNSNVSCNGGNDGSVTVSVAGGTPDYDYVWSNGSTTNNSVLTTNTISALPANTYSVTITDANGCISTATQAVTEPSLLQVVFTSQTNVSCNGGSDGAATINASGGAPGYTYTWTGGASTTTTASGLSANTYFVTVTDTESCTATASVVITEPTLLTATTAVSNVNCNGGSNGSAVVTPQGGTINYTYLWNNGATGATATGLVAGNYTITVTDNNGCTVINTATIIEPLTLTVSIISSTDVSGFGSTDGSATASASNGSGAYSYSWSNGASGATANNLAAGLYTVTAIDANGCVATTTVTIFEPGALSIVIDTTINVTCNGSCNGSATISVSGGVGPYNYAWPSSANNSATETGLCAGAFTVTVTDANGYTGNITVYITQPTPLTATETSNTSVNCFGGNNGSAGVTASGGVTPYTYSWNNGGNTAIINNLTVGAYTVTVTDANSCTSIVNITITEPTQLTASVTTVRANCGLPQGTATVNANGGTPIYSFLWSNNSTLQSLSNILPGSYNVTVTDGNNCQAFASGIVADTPGVSISLKFQTEPTCFGMCDAIANVEFADGTAPFTVVCTNGFNSLTNGSNEIITGLCAGNFKVIVTDYNGCKDSVQFTITQPVQVNSTISSFSNVTCAGGNNGSAVVSGTGGVGSYTAIWNTNPVQNTLSAGTLTAGTYYVTLSDANGCSDDTLVTISEPTQLVLLTSKNDAHCSLADGSASVIATGGTVTSGYTYLWSGGSAPTNLATVNGLAAANSPFTVTVTDNNGCNATANVTINNIPPGTASIIAFTNVTCNGANDGTATVAMSGGQPPYIYQWGTTPQQSSQTATNLAPGNYTVTVTDFYTCTVTASILISQPQPLANNFTQQDPKCFSGNDGFISANITGGTIPYHYSWSPFGNTQQITGLTSGAYSVTITDDNNCTATFSTSLSQPTQIAVAGLVTDAACNQNNGEIAVSVSGGTPGYSFLWSNGVSVSTNINLSAGPYTVTVKDNVNCQTIQSFNVNNISGPVITIDSVSNVSCFGASDGNASISVNGGYNVYSYLWNTNPVQNTASVSNLGPGVYSVIVTDDSTNCVANASINIFEPANIVINENITEPLCNGDANGSIEAIVTGGTTPYQYTWFGGGLNTNDSLNTGLAAGNYTIVVTDENNCIKTKIITVDEPTFVTAVAAHTNMTCYDVCDGTANILASGGTQPYTYLWSNNQITQQAVGLCAGTYTGTVYDAHMCAESASVTVISPTAINIQATNITNVKCFGQSNGRIILAVSGGTPGYTYSWSNGSTTQNLINIPFGLYCVTVTDINGCSKDTCFVVTQPQQLYANLNKTDESCYGACDGSINTTVTGGTFPYNYLWTNASTNEDISNLCPGSYYVTVFDNNNCQVSANTNIIGYDILNLLLVNVNPATCNNSNGSAQISVIGGSSIYTYTWPAGVNSVSTFANNLNAGAYTVTVTDDHNCTASLDINVNNINGPSVTVLPPNNVKCNGANDGWLVANYSSNVAVTSVVWMYNSSQIGTGDTLTNLGPGTYSVVITDANNCIGSDQEQITQPQVFNTAITTHTDLTCYQVCSGTATGFSNGGTQPYSYLWSSGQTTSNVSGLCSGSYQLTSTDANGCQSSHSVNITQPQQLQFVSTINNVSCNGENDGQIVINATGGNGQLYSWAPSVSSNAVAAQLAPGFYNVTVSDYYDVSCFISGIFEIVEPEPLSVSTSVLPTTCGLQNGTGIVEAVYGGTPGYHFTWSPGGSTNDTLVNAASGTYQLQVYDANNCSAVFPVTIPSIKPPMLNQVQTTNVTCNSYSDGSATISLKFGTGPFTYAWQGGSVIDTSVSVINNLNAGVYNVTITDNNNCQIQTTFVISQPAPLHVMANGSRYICNGQSASITANANGGNPPYSFVWPAPMSSNAAQIVSPTTQTIYPVHVVDSKGCLSDTARVTINVHPPVIVTAFVSQDSICKGASTDLGAIASGGNGGPYTYNWFTETGTALNFTSVTPADTTTYIVYAHDNCGSPSIPDSVTVIVWPVPVIDIMSNKLKGCAPLLVAFNNVGIGNNLSYYWNFHDDYSTNNTSNDRNPTHLFENAGTYNVNLTVKTAQNCVASDNQEIVVHPVPNAEFNAYPEVVGLFHATVDFLDISGDVNNWYWDFGDGRHSGGNNPQHTYDKEGTFNVKLYVKNQFNCVDSVVHPIKVTPEHTFYAPTAFDPNSPNVNVFNPQGVGIDEKSYHLWVYDRWGEVIFETQDLYEYWNGSFNNKGDFVKSGTYAWLVRLKDVSGKWHEYVGSVTVIR